MMTTAFFKRLGFKFATGMFVGILVFLGCFIHPVSGAEKKLKQDLFSVSFPTDREGWVCGRFGTIDHTGDGGLTWTRQESRTVLTLTSIWFVDENNGWAVGDGGTILHTEDGGKKWVTQKSPLPQFFMGVQFVDRRKGWIAGEATTILYTEDGGNTWQVQFQDQDFILKSISFCDELNGWAVGEFGFIYRTEDGGKTWRNQGGKYEFSEKTGNIEGGNFLFDVVAVDPLRAWIVGIDGNVSRTVDGGITWTPEGACIPKTHIFSVTSNMKGDIIIGGNGLLMVSPGEVAGFRRLKTEPPVTYGWIYGLAPRGKDGFVAVGKGGRIYLGEETVAVGHLAAN